jgi:hypothetical protein
MKIILKTAEINAIIGTINRTNLMMFQKLKAANISKHFVGDNLEAPAKLEYNAKPEVDSYMKVFTVVKTHEEVIIEVNPVFVKEFIQTSSKSVAPLLDSFVSCLKFLDSTKKESEALYNKWFKLPPTTPKSDE